MSRIAKNSEIAQKSGGLFIALIVLLLVSSMLSTHVDALEFQCEIPGDVRYIKVEIPGREKLCEVRVRYEYNGEDKAIWHAQSDTAFCTRKAIELKEKYEQTWDYTCTSWPDREGISGLSPSQRVILDKRMKMLISRGQTSEPAFKVNSVKAVATSNGTGRSGLLALQFFLSNGTDYTEILADDNNGDASDLMGSTWNLASHVDGIATVDSALIEKISNAGVLTVQTSSVDQASKTGCIGLQAINLSSDSKVTVRTPHRSVCYQTLAEQ